MAKDKIETDFSLYVDDSSGTPRNLTADLIPGTCRGGGIVFDQVDLTGASNLVNNALAGLGSALITADFHLDDTATTGAYSVLKGIVGSSGTLSMRYGSVPRWEGEYLSLGWITSLDGGRAIMNTAWAPAAAPEWALLASIEHDTSVVTSLGNRGFYYSVAAQGGTNYWRPICIKLIKPIELDFDGLARVTLYCEADYGAGYTITVKIMATTNTENTYFNSRIPSCADNTSGTTISNGQTVYVSDTGNAAFPGEVGYFSIHTAQAAHGESSAARFKITKIEWINTTLGRYLTLFDISQT